MSQSVVVVRQCLICGRTYQRFKSKRRSRNGTYARRSNCVTCSHLCARRLVRVRAYFRIRQHEKPQAIN